MKRVGNLSLLILALVAVLASRVALGAPNAKPLSDPNAELSRLYKLYSMKAMAPDALWDSVESLSAHEKNMTPIKRMGLMQMKAEMLLAAELPVIAATYASDSIKSAKDPLDRYLTISWKILYLVSRIRPIQFILEDLANTIKLEKAPPYFVNDWNYVVANAHAAAGKDKLALESYQKINMADRYFLPALYQTAMIHLAANKIDEAELALKTMLFKNTHDASPLPQSDKTEMWNYANLALARLYYQKRDFLNATRHYRKVTKTSPLFYESQFEQAWSLFMGGHPLHALGSLYGVHSPHFQERFNPESKILEAINYYWMCRYEDSRAALGEFGDNYATIVEGMTTFVDRNHLTPDSAYQLFENLVSGVSSESLGMPRSVLNTVAQKDTMRLVRDQLATVMDEDARIKANGIFGNRRSAAVPGERIDAFMQRMKMDLGRQFLVELKAEKAHYDELYDQSQFLYVELLMSEKEQLLGKELHANKMDGKIAQNLRGWSRNTQSWKYGRGEEFWWDEIGYYVMDVEPKCNTK